MKLPGAEELARVWIINSGRGAVRAGPGGRQASKLVTKQAVKGVNRRQASN